jgi:import receptor subunit TOM22
MVKLHEVEDEHFSEEQQGAKSGLHDDDDYVDTDSEISSNDDSDDDDGTFEESIYDRLVALKDMVPPKQRAGVSKLFRAVSSGLFVEGKALW